jgi:ectoine hydroxylase-related dioxygenase (phytanoyl-CoA dioxygenase family)
MNLGELWIDRSDASAAVETLSVSKETASHLNFFMKNGYTIFKSVVPDELTDAISEEMKSVAAHPEKYVVRRTGKYVNPAEIKKLEPGHRIIDIYGVSKAAREAIFQPAVAEFLTTIFGEPAIAMQSLCFEYGSQQGIHQDTAYVVSSQPLSLAAAWIALEDVAPGSGELIYYPGSHRFNHFLFGGESKSWTKNRHGDEAHEQFLGQLHEQARQRGIQQDKFLAKKGDVLIWHADLAHGGAPITNSKQTRRSFVVHFCPLGVKPSYAKQIPQQYFELKDKSGNFFASRHYDLRSIDSHGASKILDNSPGAKKREGGKGRALAK